ncbi:hypothetical protein G7Y89_g8377 [Cudoniella acicularis]|uniref:Uncharacterized protein n=1 Tax=Cudoniella acicularis TaxID=354080 RepID=A0A8H4RKC9_9HELO|nr:hypothetical protein G7Y89_g8377 [Cudoniella acicularis]
MVVSVVAAPLELTTTVLVSGGDDVELVTTTVVVSAGWVEEGVVLLLEVGTTTGVVAVFGCEVTVCGVELCGVLEDGGILKDVGVVEVGGAVDVCVELEDCEVEVEEVEEEVEVVDFVVAGGGELVLIVLVVLAVLVVLVVLVVEGELEELNEDSGVDEAVVFDVDDTTVDIVLLDNLGVSMEVTEHLLTKFQNKSN